MENVTTITPVQTQPATTPKQTTYDRFKRINAISAADMAAQTGLDFLVRKEPVYYLDPNAIPVGVPGYCSIVREDNGVALGINGEDYGIVQYLQALEFTEVLVQQGEASYLYGGFTGHGEKAFVVMKTADHIQMAPNDDIECLFCIAASHDGSITFEVTPTPVRSALGVIMLHSKMKAIKIKHTRHVLNKMKKAQDTLMEVKLYWKQFKESFTLFRGLNMSQTQVDDYFKMLVPDSKGESNTRAENIRATMDTIYKTNPALQIPSCKGTMLGAYFAVMYYCDHHKTVRKRKNLDERSAQIEANINGSAAKQKAEAFGTALRLTSTFKGIKRS